MIFKLLELILKEKILRKDLDLVSENTPIIKTEDYDTLVVSTQSKNAEKISKLFI